MRYILWITIEILVLTPVALSLSQTEIGPSDEALAQAHQFMESGNFHEAITEYKRFLFFHPDDERADFALFKTGLAYRSLGDWQNALDALRGSIQQTRDNRVASQRQIILATTLIAVGNYSLARLELIRIWQSTEVDGTRSKAQYFDGIASLYSRDWNAAEQAFSQFYRGRDTETSMIKSLISQTRRSYKSERLAGILSTIIPGLGQTYAHDWRNGLNAFLLNGFFIGLLARTIYTKNYIDAALISSFFPRYYMGNISRASDSVRRYNDAIDHSCAVNILKIVSTDEPN